MGRKRSALYLKGAGMIFCASISGPYEGVNEQVVLGQETGRARHD